MKFYGTYQYPQAVEQVIEQLPTPGFIWPSQLGPYVDRPGSYDDPQPYEGVIGNPPQNGPVAYSGYGALLTSEGAQIYIWYTDIFPSGDEAVETAMSAADNFWDTGFTDIVNAGVEKVAEDAYRGFILFRGSAPPGSEPVEVETKKEAHFGKYAIGAGIGFGAAIVIGFIGNLIVRG